MKTEARTPPSPDTTSSSKVTSVQGLPGAVPDAPDGEPSSLAPGTVLAGRYQVEHRIGAGGMAEVYAVSQFQIGAALALKLMRDDLALPDDELANRFLAEARAVASISHPNVVRVFDYGKTPDGRPYMVMERLEGWDLEQHLAHYGTIALDRALPWLLQVASALQAAHRQGIVHADLKPQNVFLCHGQGQPTRVKLLDFGLAQSPARGLRRTEMAGTPGFMAPEQFRGQPIDPRTDVYAFGALIHNVLTGRSAFDLDTWVKQVRSGQTPHPLPLRGIGVELSPSIARIIDKAMAEDPGQRFQDMPAMAAALRRCNAASHTVTRSPRPARAHQPLRPDLPSEAPDLPDTAVVQDETAPDETQPTQPRPNAHEALSFSVEPPATRSILRAESNGGRRLLLGAGFSLAVLLCGAWARGEAGPAELRVDAPERAIRVEAPQPEIDPALPTLAAPHRVQHAVRVGPARGVSKRPASAQDNTRTAGDGGQRPRAAGTPLAPE